MANRPSELEPEEEFPHTAGTFRTSRPVVRVSVKNQTYVLREGVDLVIEAPQLAQAMRQVARYQPRHGISEVHQ